MEGVGERRFEECLLISTGVETKIPCLLLQSMDGE